MSAESTHAEHAHHSPFHYDYSVLNRLGLWLFFASETMIFLVLLVVRFANVGVNIPAENVEGHHISLPQELGLLITVILLASSITAFRAEVAIAAGDRKKMLNNLLGTIIMGTIFLFAVVFKEWPEAAKHGIIPNDPFGGAFFAMTGMHAFHVFTGILMLIFVYLNGRKGAYSAEKHWGVEAVVKYWHLVDLVWVFFYPALYLLETAPH